MLKHDSVIQPRMYLASLDIKAAFDETRRKHVTKNMESHDAHG